MSLAFRVAAIAPLALALGGCGHSTTPDADVDASFGSPVDSGHDAGGSAPLRTSTDASKDATTVIDSAAHVGFANGTWEGFPNKIASDSDYLYWGTGGATENTGAIVRASPDGTSQVTLAPATFPFALAVDADNVYFVDWLVAQSDGALSELQQVPRLGGDVVTLARRTTEGIGIAVANGNVYWFEQGTWSPDAGDKPTNGAVLRVPIGGGTVTTLATVTTALIEGIAADETNVYWSVLGDGVYALAGDAGTPTVLATDPGILGVGAGVAIDDTYVYFARGNGVSKVPKAGGAAVTLTTFANDNPLSLARLGDGLFYVATPGGAGFDGYVRRVDLADDSVTTIAHGTTTAAVGALSVAPGRVYWEFMNDQTGAFDIGRYVLPVDAGAPDAATTK